MEKNRSITKKLDRYRWYVDPLYTVIGPVTFGFGLQIIGTHKEGLNDMQILLYVFSGLILQLIGYLMFRLLKKRNRKQVKNGKK